MIYIYIYTHICIYRLINDLKCLIDGVHVYAQFIFSFMLSEVAYAANQTTQKKTKENRADSLLNIIREAAWG